jgi:hypothetical protein
LNDLELHALNLVMEEAIKRHFESTVRCTLGSTQAASDMKQVERLLAIRASDVFVN